MSLTAIGTVKGPKYLEVFRKESYLLDVTHRSKFESDGKGQITAFFIHLNMTILTM